MTQPAAAALADPALARWRALAPIAILAGIGGAKLLSFAHFTFEAIGAGLAEARGEDIVLLAGKGHEQGQIVGDRVLPFDDVQVARECAG